jgi:predicted peptidase
MNRLAALLLVVAANTMTILAETGFLDRTVTVAGETYGYQVYVPPDWSSKQRWPVILFLHGGGERGRDGMSQTQVGIGGAIRRDRSRFPAVVVFPQARESRRWSELAMQEVALAALDSATKEFNGDPDRIYATGLSLGGEGVVKMTSRFPSRFAAIVSVCGPYSDGGKRDELDRGTYAYLSSPDPFAALAEIVKGVPMWLFHGDADAVVPVEQSRKLAAALKNTGADVRYTEYTGVNHNSWDKAFAEPELMQWLMTQRRRTR